MLKECVKIVQNEHKIKESDLFILVEKILTNFIHSNLKKFVVLKSELDEYLYSMASIPNYTNLVIPVKIMEKKTFNKNNVHHLNSYNSVINKLPKIENFEQANDILEFTENKIKDLTENLKIAEYVENEYKKYINYHHIHKGNKAQSRLNRLNFFKSAPYKNMEYDLKKLGMSKKNIELQFDLMHLIAYSYLNKQESTKRRKTNKDGKSMFIDELFGVQQKRIKIVC